MFGQHQQPLRGLTRFHAPRAFPSASEEVCTELTAETQVVFHLAQPAGETAGIGERRPEVVDVGVEAVFHAHDPLSLTGAAAQQCLRFIRAGWLTGR